jgi:hypothetical protein
MRTRGPLRARVVRGAQPAADGGARLSPCCLISLAPRVRYEYCLKSLWRPRRWCPRFSDRNPLSPNRVWDVWNWHTSAALGYKRTGPLTGAVQPSPARAAATRAAVDGKGTSPGHSRNGDFPTQSLGPTMQKEMTGLLHCFLTLFGGGDWKRGGGLLRAIPSYALIVTGHRVLVHLPCLIITLEAVPFVTEDVRRHDRISSCQDHQQGWARSGR